MNKIILFIVLILIVVLIHCQIATEDTIVGTWKATHALGVSVDGDYYKFKSNETYSRDPDKRDLFDEDEAYNIGTYEIDGSGNLTLSEDNTNTTWKVYLYGGTTMYWYLNGIEAVRFSKQ